MCNYGFMNSEIRTCQNCKKDFEIEARDFAFYEKMDVPPPTFCHLCRYQRRLMFRNERVLYKRPCDLCAKPMMTVFSPENPAVVYCLPCWWTADWDGLQYGREYDSRRPFFEQFRELQKSVPFPALTIDYLSMVNSDYTNYAGHCKNCYLVFDGDNGENVLYAKTFTDVKDSMDILNYGESQLCYENVSGGYNSEVFYSQDCADCLRVYFSAECTGCTNCFGCINLKNKQYHIFNTPYSKEEYEKNIAEYRLNTREGIARARRDTDAFFKTIPRKYMHERRNADVTGEYVYESKNAHDIYIARRVEDSRFCQSITMEPVKDCYDYTEWGAGAEKLYECITVGEGSNNVRFSWAVWKQGTMDVEYSMFINSSQNLFGCVGLRKKDYSILNKQYSKEEYEKLRVQIIEDMKNNPYVDKKGRVFRYGEFFPYDLSFFSYNESTAIQFFPIVKEEALERGWGWRESGSHAHQPTKQSIDLPESIHDVSDEIIQEIIGCPECGKAYRVVKAELELLRRFGFPLPDRCPDCRHFARLKRLNPPQLWDRQCDCGGDQSKSGVYTNTTEHLHGKELCGESFKTAYSPDREETIYCDQCFKKEFI